MDVLGILACAIILVGVGILGERKLVEKRVYNNRLVVEKYLIEAERGHVLATARYHPELEEKKGEYKAKVVITSPGFTGTHEDLEKSVGLEPEKYVKKGTDEGREEYLVIVGYNPPGAVEDEKHDPRDKSETFRLEENASNMGLVVKDAEEYYGEVRDIIGHSMGERPR